MMDGREQEHLDLIVRHQSMMGLDRCESEEALGSSESDPAMPARPRGKRSRAAEVHNLSEKRRRSRINDKMKALQSLIPNSSKTDKASMLDDAIDYLKQLQLQVQMLSMRNGLYLPPVNLSGTPELLPVPQMCAALNQNNAQASDPPVVLQSVNQISGARHSFEAPHPDLRQHKPLFLPGVPSTTTSEPRFLVEPLQSSLQSLGMPESAETIYQEEMMLKHRLPSAQETTAMPGNEIKSVRQETSMMNAHFHRYAHEKEQSQNMMPKNTESVHYMAHLHRCQLPQIKLTVQFPILDRFQTGDDEDRGDSRIEVTR